MQPPPPPSRYLAVRCFLLSVVLLILMCVNSVSMVAYDVSWSHGASVDAPFFIGQLALYLMSVLMLVMLCLVRQKVRHDEGCARSRN